MKKLSKRQIAIIVLIFAIFIFSVIINRNYEEPLSDHTPHTSTTEHPSIGSNNTAFSYSLIPETDGITPYVEVNSNVPYFIDADLSRTDPFETYSELDELGRCGPAYANICVELMPTEKRGDISSVKPTGWHSVTYPDLIADQHLYNRCHLIGFQLAGENANKLNLITGTRYLNVTGMLVFEDQVANYIKGNPNNHVLYRVTPIFLDDDLVARGVLMEAYSVEDYGELQFCVFCYNIQPGIIIDYKTGDNWEA